MGHTAKPICHNCGYTTDDVGFGAGRANHLKLCAMPAVNFDTNEIVTLDYFEKIKTVRYLLFFKKTVREKGNYVFYCESGMSVRNKDTRNHNWKDLEIPQTGNFCPKCKKYELEFILQNLFD